MAERGGSYYADKVESLRDLFGATRVDVTDDGLIIDDRAYSVIDDVIIALPDSSDVPFDPGVRHSFGEEWTAFGAIEPEHRLEFEAYFDLVDLGALKAKRVGDLGCGSGRWASFLAPHVGELVLVDFSDAIFVARANLRHASNAIFLMADVLALPFRPEAFAFAYSLGVLHHLPVDALGAVRGLRRFSPALLVYLYYDLDHRPPYFRALLWMATAARRRLSKIRSRRARLTIASVLATAIYLPVARLGGLLPPRARTAVPLVETYRSASLRRIRQDAYDRFFTSIEQRVTHAEIEALEDTFSKVTISDSLPYWHFLCEA